MTSTSGAWESLSATLLISGAELAPGEITRRLGVPADLAREPHEVPAFRDGAGCWGLTVSGGEVGDTLASLLSRITHLSRELAALRGEGYRVTLDIAGRVDTGRPLVLPAALLADVAELGVPLSFTTVATAAPAAADPFDWLPPADGSHRA